MNIAGGAMAIDTYQNAGNSDYARAGLAMGVRLCNTFLVSHFHVYKMLANMMVNSSV